MAVALEGASDGCLQTVMVNSVPPRPLKQQEKDIEKKRVRRNSQRREELEKINTMRLWVGSDAPQ